MATDPRSAPSGGDDPPAAEAATAAAGSGFRDAAAKDTAGARDFMLALVQANAAEAWTPPILSYGVVAGFFGLLYVLMFGRLGWIDKAGGGPTLQLVNIGFGAATAGFSTVLNYWLGSSLGSRRKDRALATTTQFQQVQAVAPPPATIQPADDAEPAKADEEQAPPPPPIGRAAIAEFAAFVAPGHTHEVEEAGKYKDAVRAAAAACNIDQALIYAVGSRESDWGLTLKPPGPAGTGDWAKRDPAKWGYAMPPDHLGWGRGLMQIDYQQSFGQTGDWRDPAKNILHGAQELAGNIAYYQAKPHPNVDHVRAGIAAYNCGRGGVNKAISAGEDVDSHTAGHNYSADVIRRQAWFGSLLD